MYAMGIDIGTTTISFALVDEGDGALIDSATVPHGAFIGDGCPVGRTQDPGRIRALALEGAEALIRRHGPPGCVGLTGQMHGMLYVDGAGRAASPLYTWQDGRGGLPIAGGRSAVELLKDCGCAAATGYGLATHVYLERTGGVPDGAAAMTTIPDYVGMALTGQARCRISADMAASWGAFDLERRTFQCDRLDRLAGFDARLLPAVSKRYAVVGETAGGAPVICALGDNQASLLGSVKDPLDAALINIGTGSQISVGVARCVPCQGGVELRPCGDGYILAGSGLCGGRAYALLEAFYREIAGSEAPVYDRMQADAAAFIERHGVEAAWRVRTTFSGTREDPDARGEIRGVGIDNFRPGALTAGVVLGILEELREAYERICALTGKRPGQLAGAGNGLRANPVMREQAQRLFGLRLNIPVHREEAAFGAAITAMTASGRVAREAARDMIRYE